jgi:hypothetical protein
MIGNCSVGNCSVSNCSVCNCSVGNCSVGNCSVGNCSVGNTSGLITLRFVKTPLLPVGAGRHVVVDDHVFHRMLVQREMNAVVRVIQTTQSKRSVLVIDNDGVLGQWIVGCKSAEEGVGRG